MNYLPFNPLYFTLYYENKDELLERTQDLLCCVSQSSPRSFPMVFLETSCCKASWLSLQQGQVWYFSDAGWAYQETTTSQEIHERHFNPLVIWINICTSSSSWYCLKIICKFSVKRRFYNQDYGVNIPKSLLYKW